MTVYKQQTNIANTQQGEIAILGDSQIATVDATSTQVNLSNTAVAASYDRTYVGAIPDISSAQTMTDAAGNSLVFLNTNSYDSTSQSSFEFEEADGRVYGLYSRASGIGQELFYGSAKDSKQQAQLSVYKYQPSWLSGTGWVASHVLGGDCNGFCLVLYDPTTAMSQTNVRYVYVKLTTNSLIDVAGHQYVEITPFVRSWLSGQSGVLQDVNHIPLIRRGQYHTFVEATDSLNGYVYLTGFVNDDVTYPFTTATLPASPAAFTPAQVTFTKSGWFDGTTGSGTTIVVASPHNGTPLQVCSSTGTILPVTRLSLPYSNQLSICPNSMCFEVSNNGTTEALTFLTPVYVYYTNSLGVADSMNSEAGFTFVRTGTGASVTLTYQTPDQHYGQPYPWIITERLAGSVVPNESVISNVSQPLTCANKLPCLSSYILGGAYDQLVINSFYSGNGSVSSTGISGTLRAAFQYLNGQGGSSAQAQLAKFNWAYPNLNVSPRINSFTGGNAVLLPEITVPSGLIYYQYGGGWIGQNIFITDGLLNGPNVQAGRPGLVISSYPAGSMTGARTLYSGTLQCQCFPTRISEYQVAYSSYGSQKDPIQVGVCYTNGGSVNSPVHSIGTVLFWDYNGSKGNTTTPNFQLGQFTVDSVNKLWNPPSTAVYSYSPSIATQLQQAGTALFTASGTGGTLDRIELFPRLDSTGTTPTRFFGTMFSHNGSTMRQTAVSVGLSLSGSVISIVPSDVTVIGSSTLTSTFQSTTNGRSFVVSYQVWTSATAHYMAYYGVGATSVPGDGYGMSTAMVLNGMSVTSNSTYLGSSARNPLSLSPQHMGLAGVNLSSGGIGQQDGRTQRMYPYYTGDVSTAAGLAASVQAAVTNGIGTALTSPSMAVYDLTAIQNNEVLQIGSVSGMLNRKAFNLPSTYYDLTGAATGTYYIYVVDNGTNIAFSVVPDNTILESPTSMYVGRVDKTSSGFANGVMVAVMTRFGTARLAQGHTIAPIAGSSIRWGTYPMPSM